MKTKVITRAISTGENSAMKQSELLAIPCNLFKAREKSRLQLQGAIGFGFAWVKTGTRCLGQSLNVGITIA